MATSAAAKLQIRWREQGDEGWSNPVDAPVADEIAVEGLDRNRVYEFQARAVSSCGAASVWVGSDYAVPGPPPLDAPFNLTATSVADGVGLKWEMPNEQAASVDYVVEKAPTIGGPWTEATRVRSLQWTDPVIDTTINWYRVKAVNFAGEESAYSNVVDEHGRTTTKMTASETAPDNPAVNEQWYQPSTRYMYYWNGSEWKINSALVPEPAGRELVPNHSFGSTRPAPDGYAADGWWVDQQSPSWTTLSQPGSFLLRVDSGATIPHNTQHLIEIKSDRFPVTGGTRIRRNVRVAMGWLTVPPAGVTTLTRHFVSFYDASGGYITQFSSDINRVNGTSSSETTADVPTNATSAEIAIVGYLVNLSGAQVTLGSLPFDASIDMTSVVVVNELEIAGSGKRLGDARNQAMVTVGNYGSAWSGLNVTYSSTTTSATLTASAATLQAGGAAIPYSQSQVTVSGSPGATATYYLYYDDPAWTGGAKALNATTVYIDSINADGKVLVATVSVTYPTSGTGGGSGGNPCVAVDAWVIRRVPAGWEFARAGEVEVGDELRVIDPATGAERWGVVSMSRPAPAECVRVVTEAGTALTCSTSAPLGTPYGQVLAPDALGCILAERRSDVFGHSHCVEITPAGERIVQHITCENDFFLAGDNARFLLAHHNLKPFPIEP